MMLDSAKLANEVMSKMQQKGFKKSKENEDFIISLSEAFIEHLRQNAVVETKGNAAAQIGSIK